MTYKWAKALFLVLLDSYPDIFKGDGKDQLGIGGVRVVLKLAQALRLAASQRGGTDNGGSS